MSTAAVNPRFPSRPRPRKIVLSVGPAVFTFTAQVRPRAERPPVSFEDQARIDTLLRDTRGRLDEMVLRMGRRTP